MLGVSKVQFCTTERPQLFEFEVASCKTSRLRSKKAILEVAMSNLKKMTRLCSKLGSLHADLTPQPQGQNMSNTSQSLFGRSALLAQVGNI